MLVELVLTWLLAMLVSLVLLYRHVTKDFRRWLSEGIPHLSPTFPYGSHPDIPRQAKHINQIVREDYERFKGEPLYGWHLFGKPVLGINSLDLVQRVLSTDFSSFVDRMSAGLLESGGNLDKHWLKQLTNLSGEEWRETRHTFSPVFTPSRIKGMMHIIRHVVDRLVEATADLATLDQDFQLKHLFEKFSLDSLASCAFGVDPDSFRAKDSRFMQYARELFVRTSMDKLFLLLRITPIVSKVLFHLKINTFKPKQTRFFRDVVLGTIKQRRHTGERKNDLIDLMIDCMDDSDDNGGDDNDDKGDTTASKGRKIDEETIVSTAMVLLVAGFDTTSMTLSFMAYHLSQNPGVQERLQEEVDAACLNSPQDFPDYDAIQGMVYLDNVVQETIRLHPPAGLLMRMCTADYSVPGTNIQIKKDDLVSISVSGIHSDPDHYPNPDEFNPDNFTKEAKTRRKSCSFLGFSHGPRACIGQRFALLEIKVSMIALLRRFTFLYSQLNPGVLVIDPTSHMGFIKGGLWARVVEREAAGG